MATDGDVVTVFGVRAIGSHIGGMLPEIGADVRFAQAVSIFPEPSKAARSNSWQMFS